MDHSSFDEDSDICSTPDNSPALLSMPERTIIPPTPTPASKQGSSTSAAVRRLSFRIGLPEFKSAGKRSAGTVEADEACTQASTDQNGILKEILTEVKKTNVEVEEMKVSLSEMDKRLAYVEQREADVSSSACSSSERQKTTVPNKIRYHVREVYKNLLEEVDESFPGFDITKRFADSANQVVVSRLVKEVKALSNGEASGVQIIAAARRFFQSKSEESALKSRGKYSSKIVQQRRRNRITRKLQLRKSALERSGSMTEERKARWRRVLTREFMSSEDSGSETLEDGSKRAVLYVRPLPWRSSMATTGLHRLDEKVKKQKSKHASQQTLTRKVGSVSTRPKPNNGFSSQFWGFEN